MTYGMVIRLLKGCTCFPTSKVRLARLIVVLSIETVSIRHGPHGYLRLYTQHDHFNDNYQYLPSKLAGSSPWDVSVTECNHNGPWLKNTVANKSCSHKLRPDIFATVFLHQDAMRLFPASKKNFEDVEAIFLTGRVLW